MKFDRRCGSCGQHQVYPFPLLPNLGVIMTESLRQQFARWRLEELLLKYPGLRLSPVTHKFVRLAGALAFSAEAPGKERIDDEYEIEVAIPEGFPERTPSVRETGGRIPFSFHKLDGGGLCLGSPTRLRVMLLESPSIICFVERGVIPYLCGYSYFEKHGTLPFGELSHGEHGIRQDLASLFGIDREDIVPQFVRLTSMKRERRTSSHVLAVASVALADVTIDESIGSETALVATGFAWYTTRSEKSLSHT